MYLYLALVCKNVPVNKESLSVAFVQNLNDHSWARLLIIPKDDFKLCFGPIGLLGGSAMSAWHEALYPLKCGARAMMRSKKMWGMPRSFCMLFTYCLMTW